MKPAYTLALKKIKGTPTIFVQEIKKNEGAIATYDKKLNRFVLSPEIAKSLSSHSFELKLGGKK